MFAGIASVMLNEDGTIIHGIASREGEEVVFDKPVSTIEHPRINEWLSEVERQMRLTLANNLAKAVQHAKTFRDGQVEADPFVKWVDSFQVIKGMKGFFSVRRYFAALRSLPVRIF